MTKNEDICDMSAYRLPQTEEEKVIDILKVLKGKKLEDGGTIEGFTITFTNKKTKKKRIVKI